MFAKDNKSLLRTYGEIKSQIADDIVCIIHFDWAT